MSTYMAKPNSFERKWYVIDAAGVPLGRLSTEVARLLRGKHKPIFTPHIDTGDFVIVINADQVVLTGKKLTQKMFYRHSNFPGGLKVTPYKRLMEEKPELAVEHAVKGMIPHNRLGRQIYRKLFVYSGAEHPHQAQTPENWDIKGK